MTTKTNKLTQATAAVSAAVDAAAALVAAERVTQPKLTGADILREVFTPNNAVTHDDAVFFDKASNAVGQSARFLSRLGGAVSVGVTGAGASYAMERKVQMARTQAILLADAERAAARINALTA